MPSIRKLSLFASALAGSAAAHGSGHAHLHRALHQRQASQINDGQVQAPSAVATQIGDGQVQAPTAAATQIGDGQVQAPGPVSIPQSYCGTVTATTTIWVQPTTTEAAGTCPAMVTETVTVCGPSPTSSAPAWTSTPSTSSYVAPTTSSTPSSSPVSTSSAAPTSMSSSTPVSSAPVSYAPSSTSAAAYTPTPSPSSYGGNSAPIAANGDKWAMTYTPYNPDGTCRAASDVASDIASIAGKGFKSIRIYATDCSGVQNVGDAAKANGMNMILGIYIDSSGLGQNTQDQLNTILAWGNQGNWDHVEMIVAGNEAIFNNWVSGPALAGFINEVKTAAKAAGFGGVVTTTEPIETITANGDVLCPVVDVIAANMHPFFNPNTPASDAGPFVANSLNALSAVCNHSKTAYNLETGWPTQGDANGLAVPGMANQETAVNGILASAGSHCVIFSFANDPWKSPGPLDVEQYWGAGHLFAH